MKIDVRTAIECLGGPKAVADRLKLHRNTVQVWSTQNRVSSIHAPAFFSICRQFKLDINLVDIVRKTS